MNIEIVVSCWNYWRALTYHLSALVLHPPINCSVTATVCYCPQDGNTSGVLRFFGEFISSPCVRWKWIPFEQKRLMRRAIARNQVARSCTADWLVFTDVDYIYRGAVFDSMSKALSNAGDVLAYTPDVMQSKTHGHGEQELAKVTGLGVYELTGGLYEPARLERPIGGSQIIRGDTARRIGYVPDQSRFHRSESRWKRTFEDVKFRETCGLPVLALKTRGVHRIRHARRGREHLHCEN